MTADGRGVLGLREAIASGELTAEEVTRGALESVRAGDRRTGALTQIFEEEALEDARRIDGALRRGESPGRLAGIPFTAKDILSTLRGRTTAGSRILEHYRAPYEATAVRRMREAGAILLGKTNLDEFAMGSSTENSAFHPVRNPWDPSRVPGGSSGGAGALAGLTRGMIHLGSDTGGSIRQPASFSSSTGLKPTYGRVSRYGLIAYGSSLDQIGPLGRDAAECALALSVIAGADPRDSTAADVAVPDYLAELTGELKGLRIGIPREYFPPGIEPEVKERVREGIEKFRELGVELREVSLPHTEYAAPAYYVVATAEASSNLARYDGVHYGHRSPGCRDIIELYSRSRSEGFGREVKRRILLGTFVLSSGYYDAYYLRALKVRALIRKDFDEAFEQVDAIACPTSPVLPFKIGDRIDDPLQLYAVDILTVSANLGGVPGISFPCGFSREGLPVGMQILGRPFEDAVVLRLADAFQRVTDHHRRLPGE